jgi:hypothetical protein
MGCHLLIKQDFLILKIKSGLAPVAATGRSLFRIVGETGGSILTRTAQLTARHAGHEYALIVLKG